jgi:Alcohol acetyltransferase
MDRFFYIQHRLGLQSNIIVSALYSSSTLNESGLSKENVISALKTVISNHPELGLVGVLDKSTKKGHHILHLALLNSINLDTCVEFIDDDGLSIGPEFFERVHREWPWTSDEPKPEQPWWKVMVIGRRQVVFVFHHVVCDGRFGLIFHREFLAALNSQSSSDNSSGQLSSNIIQLDPARVKMGPKLEAFWHKQPSMLHVIYTVLLFFLVRLFWGGKLLFSDFPEPKPDPKLPIAICKPADRYVTRVASFRIPSAKMEKILTACRAHGTTFTPLFCVIITCTLAADYYPKAKIGICRYTVDLRPLFRKEELDSQSGAALNLVSGDFALSWLDKYRRAVEPTSSENANPTSPNDDAERIWALVKRFDKRIQKSRKEPNPRAKQNFWAGNTKALGSDLEDLVSKSIPAMASQQQNSFNVSNLGSFSPQLEHSSDLAKDSKDSWKIEDVQLSTGGSAGHHGILFGLVGLKGGDTVINASWEDGMMPDDMCYNIIAASMARLESLI